MSHCYRPRLVWFIVALSIVTGLALNVFGASTGQVKGVITDEKSGDPVVGATVFVVGTNFGGFTDGDGKYTVLRVDPGVYVVKVSSIGYTSVEVTDVIVKADLTTEVNAKLITQASDLDVTITVKATADIIDKFQTDNRVSISKETIARQPVTTVDDLVTQVAGVVMDQAGDIYIRGGRAGEVAYIVDGVPLGDPLGGEGQAGAALSLVSGSIQEFTVIKDGFDPEYGDALSGVVKITTQTGSKDYSRLNMYYLTDDLGNEALNDYSRNYDYLRVSLKGPDPILGSKILPAIGLNFLEDKEFTYYLYAEVDKSDGTYQYETYDTPITRRNRRSFNFFGLDIPERLTNKYYYMANLKFRPKQNMKFILSYKKSETRGTSFDWFYRYTPNTAPVYTQDWTSLSLEVSQALSKDMSYEMILSFTENGYQQKPGDPNNPGHGLDPYQFARDWEWETWNDDNGNGVYDAPEPLINLFPDTARYGDDWVGPAYTYGEGFQQGNGNWVPWWEENEQAGPSGRVRTNFRFNNNNRIDSLEGEPFLDLNGNGVWDSGEYLRDKNGNGILDANRVDNIYNRSPEPYVDGDSIIGEPFVDNNANGIYDPGIDVFDRLTMDLNRDGKYNGPGPQAVWTEKVPYVDRNGNGVFDRRNFQYDPGEPFEDRNGNGIWDGGGSRSFLDPLTHSENATWHNRRTKEYRGEFKLFRQVGQHEFKFGALFKIWDFVFQDIRKPYLDYNGRADGGPYPTRGAFRDMFEYEPWGGTVYFRDKLEYGSMIASLGFRWDFFIQDADQLVPIARQDDLGAVTILGDRQKFSPRIGFSYPISDKAKVHFNYGHFFQLPQLRWMYSRNTSNVDQNDVIGNFNLDYKKTIQYSFGIKYAMSEYYSVDVSGYFKDEFDKVNSARVKVGGLTREQYRNSDYGRSRGFELQLEKRGGGYVDGFVSYVYSFAFGKASEAEEGFLGEDELERRPLSEHALDIDIRHVLKSSVQVYIPTTVKPRLFGIPIPNGWSLSVITQIESGRPFTPTKKYPNLTTIGNEQIRLNSLRKPSVINFDARFSKEFKLVGLDYRFNIWVENVFNSRNVNSVYGDTGRPDTQSESIGAAIPGGTPFDLNPSNWNYGRQIRLGFEVDI